MKIFFSTSCAVPVALAVLSLAGSNRAADTEPQKGALKSGARLWAENCMICHEVKPPGSFSSAKWEAITRHMREEADLSPEEQEAILEFLKSDN
jgi:mono/diheme cytochrome c family protein